MRRASDDKKGCVMDPDATLAAFRKALADYRNADYADEESAAADEAIEAAEALDHWLTMGGFPPESWTR